MRETNPLLDQEKEGKIGGRDIVQMGEPVSHIDWGRN